MERGRWPSCSPTPTALPAGPAELTVETKREKRSKCVVDQDEDMYGVCDQDDDEVGEDGAPLEFSRHGGQSPGQSPMPTDKRAGLVGPAGRPLPQPLGKPPLGGEPGSGRADL
jgi:hypothetical protein